MRSLNHMNISLLKLNRIIIFGSQQITTQQSRAIFCHVSNYSSVPGMNFKDSALRASNKIIDANSTSNDYLKYYIV